MFTGIVEVLGHVGGVEPGARGGRRLAVAVPDGEGGSRTLVGPPVALSRTPARMRRTQGPSGEHSEEILGELGLTPDEIGALRDDKVI